jgi:uncharacterized membrane-anchored protein
MSNLSIIFLILGTVAVAVFFLVKKDKNLYNKRLKKHSSGR